jgi:hypothetical protein
MILIVFKEILFKLLGLVKNVSVSVQVGDRQGEYHNIS